MEALTELDSLGLEIPTLAYLIGATFFGIVGWIAFRRGRKASTGALTWVGLVLMLYPCIVSETWLLWAIGLALCGWVYAQWTPWP